MSFTEQTILATIKKTMVGRKCEEMARSAAAGQPSTVWNLTDRQRKNPKEGAAAESRASKGFEKFLDWGKDTVVDVGTPAADVASSAVDYTGGGKDRSWVHVANKNPDEAKAWSDGEIQSSGIPIAGAIVKSINTIVQVGKLAFKLKDYFQERKESKQRDPAHKAHTHDERWEMFMETVETIQSLLDSVLAWHGSFTTYLGQLPVIGAIIGAVNAGIGLVEDAIRLGKAEHYLRHIRAQKADAKLAVKNTQGALSGRNEYGSEQTKKYGFFHLKSKKRFKVNREFEATTGARADRSRKIRLDEKTKQLRDPTSQAAVSAAGLQGSTPEKREEAIRALEDYDVLKEITEANEHRRREGITKIILKDILGMGTALASIDPSALGSTIGAAVNTAVNVGFFIQKSVGSLRQKLRATGALGANQNKSDANKLQRRHNLAVVMYDRVRELADTDVAAINGANNVPIATARKVTEGTQKQFQLMDERIRAMGVAGPFLRSKSGFEMVKDMRKGFYRDN